MSKHDLHKIAANQTRDAITRWIEEEEEMIKDGVSSALDFLSDSEAAAVIAIVRGRLLHVEPDYEVSVRPDQTLSALLLDTHIDITNGRFAIVKVGEWDAGIRGSDDA